MKNPCSYRPPCSLFMRLVENVVLSNTSRDRLQGCACGITGPVLAACLFGKSEASAVVTDVLVSPLALCEALQDESPTLKEGLLSCSSIRRSCALHPEQCFLGHNEAPV